MTTPTDDLDLTMDVEMGLTMDTDVAVHLEATMDPPTTPAAVAIADPPMSPGRRQPGPSRTFRLPKVPPVTARRFIVPLVLGVLLWTVAWGLTGSATFRAAWDRVAWSWILLALVVTQLTVVSEAVAVSGTTTRVLSLRDLVRVQSATTLTGFLGGTVGAMATVIRALTQRGLDPALAYGSGALQTVTGFAVRLVLLVVFLPFALDQLHRAPAGPSGSSAEILQLILYTITAAGLVGGLDFAIPRVRRAWRNRRRPAFEPAWTNVDLVASRPDNVFALLAASALTQLVLAAGLAATLHAVGAYANFGGILLVVCFGSLVGALAPLPGGIPVVEASYISGLTLFGVPQDLAVVTTLLFRACTTYLPPLWGHASWRWLRRRDLL